MAATTEAPNLVLRDADFLAARQPEYDPVQAIAVLEGLQDWQADGVPVEGDRLLVPRAPPRDPQRTCGQVHWPAHLPGLRTHIRILAPRPGLLRSPGLP
jgi:hypothetical protein